MPKSSSSQKRGQVAEDLAEAYLISEGYLIVTRNYRSKYGEVDIIARDEEMLCFVEVKQRSASDDVHPFEAVDKSKQQKIVAAAMHYLFMNFSDEINCRFDVVGIQTAKGQEPQVELLKNAFEVGF